jgi:hypothetical protein
MSGLRQKTHLVLEVLRVRRYWMITLATAAFFVLLAGALLIISGMYLAGSWVESIRILPPRTSFSTWLSISTNNILDFPAFYISMRFGATVASLLPITFGALASQLILGVLAGINVSLLMHLLEKSKSCKADLTKTSTGVSAVGISGIAGTQLTTIAGSCPTCFGITAATAVSSAGAVSGVLSFFTEYALPIKALGGTILLLNLYYLTGKEEEAFRGC